MLPPCGVPCLALLHSSFSITPALSHFLMCLNTRSSAILCPTVTAGQFLIPSAV